MLLMWGWPRTELVGAVIDPHMYAEAHIDRAIVPAQPSEWMTAVDGPTGPDNPVHLCGHRVDHRDGDCDGHCARWRAN